MPVLASARSRRRLALAWVLAVAAMVLLALPATPASAVTGCEPTANVPKYNSYTHWSSADAYIRCGGYYDLKLVTSSGTTLARQSGNYLSPMSVYTTWVNCPAGTYVRTYIYVKINVQGNTWTHTATSAYLLCP